MSANRRSAVPPIAAVKQVGQGPPLSADFVAKVPNCRVLIFARKTIRPATVDRHSLNHVPEVAREFIVRR
jgi:hypothetical protein